MFDYKAIGLRIKAIRLHRELTQEQLAEMTGLSSPHISNVETGKTKVSLPSLAKIADVLDACIDEIMYGSKQSRHNNMVEMKVILSDCNDKEVRIIVDTARALKTSMRQSFNIGYI